MAGISVLSRYFPNIGKYPDRFIFGTDWLEIADIRSLITGVAALPASHEIKVIILYKHAGKVLDMAMPK